MHLSDYLSRNRAFSGEQLKSFPQLLQNIHCLEVCDWTMCWSFCYVFPIWWFTCYSDLLFTYLSWLIALSLQLPSQMGAVLNNSLLLHYINFVRDESLLLRLYHWLSQTLQEGKNWCLKVGWLRKEHDSLQMGFFDKGARFWTRGAFIHYHYFLDNNHIHSMDASIFVILRAVRKEMYC